MQLAYPHNPGSKDSHGSLEAAIAITKSGKHAYQLEIVEAVFRSHREKMSADTAWSFAPENTIDIHSFRSRTSELTGKGILTKFEDNLGKSITGKSVSRYIWAGYVAPVFVYENSGQGAFAI